LTVGWALARLRDDAANSFQIRIFSVETGPASRPPGSYNSYAPAWDSKGEFIYFLTDRNLQTLVGAPWGNRRPEPFFDKEIEIYQVALVSIVPA
jgi:tricorn protease